jgi:hypothetical protein
MDVVFRARVKSIFARDIYVYERHLLVMSVHRLADIEEGAVQIWDVRSGQSVAELLRHDSVSPVLSRNKHDVSANCTRADGNYFVVGSNHQNVWLFDRRTWRCVASLGEGMFKDWVWCVDIDGGQVISGDNGRGVLMWDVNTLQVRREPVYVLICVRVCMSVCVDRWSFVVCPPPSTIDRRYHSVQCQWTPESPTWSSVSNSTSTSS